MNDNIAIFKKNGELKTLFELAVELVRLEKNDNVDTNKIMRDFSRYALLCLKHKRGLV